MYGQCLLISENRNNISILGQELITYSENNYIVKLIHFEVKYGSVSWFENNINKTFTKHKISK